MSEEDPFAEFKNSSALHAAIIFPDGALIIAAPISGDEEALMAFQPVVLKILEVAAKQIATSRSISFRGDGVEGSTTG